MPLAALPADDDPGFTARLSAVVARALGGPGSLRRLVTVTGGATKRTYGFEAYDGSAWRPLILQMSTAAADNASGFFPKLDAAQDAALMRSAAAVGVAVPTVHAVLGPGDGLGDGYVTGRIAGEALGRRIVHDPIHAAARRGLTRQLGEQLARIHRIDRSAHSELVELGAARQIDAFAGILGHYQVVSPALEYALAWCRAHRPVQRATTVVHADFRMGNLIVDAQGVAGVLDWEAAHAGDPMQDLGYLCVRSWRFGGAAPVAGIGSREALFAAYEAAGGCQVDPDAVRFWEAWGNVKWALAALRKGLQYRDRPDRPASLEQCAIGRRVEEPLWDFFQLIGGRDIGGRDA